MVSSVEIEPGEETEIVVDAVVGTERLGKESVDETKACGPLILKRQYFDTML